ncbi:hypothetical protein [Lactiplantibacillus fabifermentans]|uniref:Uncharacterized protein n=2 Tax=Lactiplantibacillus fabifermentans TaxID=483011 RepID=A0A0R2NV13_9LACO|nr:hypothetical protein [Lactiplantibacillus fabifermentans]ETY75043.1 hypothetical protein LFAB_03885 [Lactiplantibacillus fabifermentans T30PCM01]KRO29582.1 hypothetical protein DY78_GL002265 [Lactiplantibacillus fabifermentans DSM 21115]
MQFLYTTYPTGYRAQDFLTTFSWSNPQIGFVLAVAGITFFIGYLEYMYSFALVIREKSAPYPIWMHTFYFAHDSMGAIVFALTAHQYHNFWFFWAASIALMVWNCFEIFNLYKAIYVERDAIWGHLYADGHTPLAAAWGRVISQIILMITIVNVFRVFMHDPLMFKWFIFTNVLIGVFPGLYWEQRQTQLGASKGLAIVILIGTINSFLPTNMWALTSPMFTWTNNPWFYLMGVVAVIYAARAVWQYDRLPKKPRSLNGKKTIW